MSIPCTVGILTFNNEATLERALDSVKNFAEIIICDGGSTDRTFEIAKSYGCVILMQDECYKYPDNRIADFSGVRNQMLKAAKQEWFFYLDSDEYISAELAVEMENTIKNSLPCFLAYSIPRRYTINDEVVDCAMTYPNYHVRFFKISAVTGFIKKVHERILIKSGLEMGIMQNFMYVPHETDLNKLKQKYNYYNNIQKDNTGDISLRYWFRWYFLWNFKVIILFLIRLFKIYFSNCRVRMPFRIELLKIKNMLDLTFQTISCIKSL